MNPINTLVALLFAVALLPAQTILYQQDFSGSTIPVDWVSNTTTTQLQNNVPSDYGGASGGNNLFMANCQPLSEYREVGVQDLSTAGYTGIELSFGHRRTNAFDVAVTLEWSLDQSSWNSLAYSTPGSASAWSEYATTLPPSVDNQPLLYLRWSWTTDDNAGCSTATPNYRIDDVTLTAASVFPVQLAALRSQRQSDRILLTFSTITETNNAHFDIERSADGRRFQPIGRVTGKGTTSEQVDYEFVDNKPLRGWNYYRLKQVDYDGAFEYYGPVSVRFGAAGQEGGVKVYPTAVHDQFTLELEAALTEHHLDCTILHANGQMLRRWMVQEKSRRTTVSVSELPAGTYWLRWQQGSEQGVTRFVKL